MDKKETPKAETILSFIIPLPITVSVSGSPEFKKRLDKCLKKQNTTQTEVFNGIILSRLKGVGIKSYKELTQQMGIYSPLKDDFLLNLKQYLSTINLSELLIKDGEKWCENVERK